MGTPDIVHKVKFIKANSRTFKNYIDYIDREEATRNYKFKEFSLYNDYMGNPEKSGSLFTESKAFLSKEDKKLLKQMYSWKPKKNININNLKVGKYVFLYLIIIYDIIVNDN